ncbi:MAG: alpha/beta hydrolase [Saprospiraceae bacterium]
MLKYSLLVIILSLLTSTTAFVQTTVPLYEDGKVPNLKAGVHTAEIVNTFKTASGGEVRFIKNITKPEIYVYLPSKKINTGKAVIICPGGGYSGLAIDHEGHDIAKKFAANGIAGIVLKNRCPSDDLFNNKSIVPLQDAQRALEIVRINAKKWKIKSNQIGIMGSSAGGHLASTVGTHFLKSETSNPTNISLRPDFMILNYPVISFADSIGHIGSRNNLIMTHGTIDPELVKYFSNELQVTANTPPTFIIHALDDKTVPIANSIVFISACLQHDIPVETFFYSHGGHGFGMDNPTADKEWIDACMGWIKKF